MKHKRESLKSWVHSLDVSFTDHDIPLFHWDKKN